MRRKAIERGLQGPGQARRRQVAPREAQHLRRHPEVASIGFQVTQVRERQQVPSGRGTGQTGTPGSQGGIQALSLRIETFQHGQTLGQPFNQICLGNGHENTRLKCCAIIAQQR